MSTPLPTKTSTTIAAAIACAGALVALIAGQAKPAAPATATADARSEQVIRVGVDLVQIDATVTDRRGRHVADLTAGDFEVLQDGRPQRISTFAYVRGTSSATKEPTRPGAPAAPTPPLTPGQVRRTIAVVVDDLGLSFESTARVREALRHVLDTQMRRGDLVAIVRTGAGSGALQQFTSDRRILDAAVERIRWNMMARASPFLSATDADRQTEAFRSEMFSAGTIGAISYIVRGIAALPGRKSVVVLSDGFRLTDATGDFGRVMDSLRALVDAANRAGVVVYCIDTRGLQTAGPGAADPGPETADARGEEIRATQDGLGYLADETGGLFVRNQNDIGRGVVRALEDQQGYYLLGYVPEPFTFTHPKPRFHRLAVRVRDPGLRVRSRKGFFGRSDRSITPQGSANRMISAVMSPFAGADIGLRLSSFFGHKEKTGAYMLSVMHIDAHDLTFTAESDGTRSADIETLAVTFGEDGTIADQNSRRFSLRLSPDAHARALNSGFVYRLQVPLKQPGPYQLRIALRDAASDRIGSATQFVDVPDVKKGRLTLSGLVIEGLTQSSQTAKDNSVEEGDPSATVAVRKFRQGTDTRYFCEIYNARRRGDQPQLEAETRLHRDGAEVFRSQPRPVPPAGPGAPTPVAVGILQLGNTIPPGSYIFEIIVTDRLADRRASQTIDFDVIQRE